MAAKRELPDRRQVMFGRKPDIDFILARVQQKGLTAVVGRPKMGKTWLLQEVSRQLNAAGYLVGYHECLGESDQMLRVVSDLYSRWLLAAENLAQARSLWERHKDSWISKAGLAVGILFSRLADIGEGVGKLVEETFQGLSKVDADLKSGGVTILPLPYEQIRELVSILNQISGKQVVMILDAWEQSAALEADRKTMSAFLSHLDDWPTCHFLLGVRHPELDNSDPTDHGFSATKDLERSKPGTARIYELPQMHLNDAIERHNLVAHVRTQIKAAGNVKDEVLFEILQAFPGVLDFWLSDSKRQEMRNGEDMKSVAADAQAYRYREFDSLFPKLSASERTVAIRLAVLPRLNFDLWQLFRPVILNGLSEEDVDELKLRFVLEGGEFPTYGHDTRHVAARRWFLNKPEYQSMIAREVEGLLFRMATYVRSNDEASYPFAATIFTLSDMAKSLKLGDLSQAITLSAATLFGIKSPDFKIFLNVASEVSKRKPTIGPLIYLGFINAWKGDIEVFQNPDLFNAIGKLLRACPPDTRFSYRIPDSNKTPLN